MKTVVKINYEKLDTPERRQKALLVENEMNIVLTSEVFKQMLLLTLGRKAYNTGEMSPWKDKAPILIYNHIMAGGEVLTPAKDMSIDIDVDDYYSIKKVVGYTTRNSKTIHVNTKYYDSRPSKLIGSNLLHEYGHKIGFEHAFFRTKTRDLSLCYLLNYVYELSWDTIFKKPHALERVLVCKRKWFFFKSCKWEYSNEINLN